MCASCQKSHQDMYIMIASHHICISVYNDQLSPYISKSLHIAELPKCANISLWLHLVLETFFSNWLSVACQTLFHWIRCLSIPLYLFLYCFSLVFHIDCDVTDIFIVVRWSDSRLFAIHHITILFQGVVTLWTPWSFSCLISLQSFWSSFKVHGSC